MKKTNFKSAYDFRKSLEARLQRNAKENGTDLQKLRSQVAFDRLLARLLNDLKNILLKALLLMIGV